MQYQAIVIGVSSGGMSALKIIFSALPANFALPIIVVQHVGPRSDGKWIDLLNAKSLLTIKEADEKETVEKGTIYFAPSNYHLLIEKDKTFSLSVEERVNFARPSIDVLFESAAEAYKTALIGVILTGANHDGAQGLKLIKEFGGLAIVQNPETAETGYMPRAAIAAVAPDFIGSLIDIAQYLIHKTQPNNQ